MDTERNRYGDATNWNSDALPPAVISNDHDKSFVHENVYQMVAEPRGQLLIINNSNSGAAGIQHASEQNREDGERLLRTFSGLGFRVYKRDQFLDVNRRRMEKLLRKFANSKLHKYADATIVVFLSHGNFRDGVYSADGWKIALEDIVKVFGESELLYGKPKIFIFDGMHGGGYPDRGVSPNGALTSANTYETGHNAETVPPTTPLSPRGLQSGNTSEENFGTKTVNNLHYVTHNRDQNGENGVEGRPLATGADMIFIYNCMQPFRAVHTQDARFVNVLCDTIDKNADKFDLLAMLTMANRRLGSHPSTFMNEFQQSCFTSSLHKLLYFNPAYFERMPLLSDDSDMSIGNASYASSARLQSPRLLPKREHNRIGAALSSVPITRNGQGTESVLDDHGLYAHGETIQQTPIAQQQRAFPAFVEAHEGKSSYSTDLVAKPEQPVVSKTVVVEREITKKSSKTAAIQKRTRNGTSGSASSSSIEAGEEKETNGGKPRRRNSLQNMTVNRELDERISGKTLPAAGVLVPASNRRHSDTVDNSNQQQTSAKFDKDNTKKKKKHGFFWRLRHLGRKKKPSTTDVVVINQQASSATASAPQAVGTEQEYPVWIHSSPQPARKSPGYQNEQIGGQATADQNPRFEHEGIAVAQNMIVGNQPAAPPRIRKSAPRPPEMQRQLSSSSSSVEERGLKTDSTPGNYIGAAESYPVGQPTVAVLEQHIVTETKVTIADHPTLLQRTFEESAITAMPTTNSVLSQADRTVQNPAVETKEHSFERNFDDDGRRTPVDQQYIKSTQTFPLVKSPASPTLRSGFDFAPIHQHAQEDALYDNPELLAYNARRTSNTSNTLSNGGSDVDKKDKRTSSRISNNIGGGGALNRLKEVFTSSSGTMDVSGPPTVFTETADRAQPTDTLLTEIAETESIVFDDAHHNVLPASNKPLLFGHDDGPMTARVSQDRVDFIQPQEQGVVQQKEPLRDTVVDYNQDVPLEEPENQRRVEVVSAEPVGQNVRLEPDVLYDIERTLPALIQSGTNDVVGAEATPNPLSAQYGVRSDSRTSSSSASEVDKDSTPKRWFGKLKKKTPSGSQDVEVKNVQVRSTTLDVYSADTYRSESVEGRMTPVGHLSYGTAHREVSRAASSSSSSSSSENADADKSKGNLKKWTNFGSDSYDVHSASSVPFQETSEIVPANVTSGMKTEDSENNAQTAPAESLQLTERQVEETVILPPDRLYIVKDVDAEELQVNKSPANKQRDVKTGDKFRIKSPGPDIYSSSTYETTKAGTDDTRPQPGTVSALKAAFFSRTSSTNENDQRPRSAASARSTPEPVSSLETWTPRVIESPNRNIFIERSPSAYENEDVKKNLRPAKEYSYEKETVTMARQPSAENEQDFDERTVNKNKVCDDFTNHISKTQFFVSYDARYQSSTANSVSCWR